MQMTFEFLIINDEVDPDTGELFTQDVSWQETLSAKDMAQLIANIHFEMHQEMATGHISTYSVFARELVKGIDY